MSKVKVKKLKVAVGSADDDLAEMFNQMIGTGTVNLTIAYPRYVRIKALCSRLVQACELLATSAIIRQYAQFQPQFETLSKYCVGAKSGIASVFSVDLEKHMWNLDAASAEEKAAFSESYAAAKKSALVNGFIRTLDNLTPYKHYLQDPKKINYKFIPDIPGTEWCPFPFAPAVNIKEIFNQVETRTNMLICTVLSKVYELSHQLWVELQSPDIDVDEFVGLLMRRIDEIQLQPELSRCRGAFAKIKDSVSLLKNNFTDYYRDFLQTGNNTIIMEHFVLDVSKSTSADARTIHEFRTIINYYRKMAKAQVNDPKVKTLLDSLNRTMEEFERGTQNLSGGRPADGEAETAPPPEETMLPTAAPMTLEDYSLSLNECSSATCKGTKK